MFIATKMGQLEELKGYIERGAPVNFTIGSETLCYIAAIHGKVDCLDYIIKKGADFNRANKDGYTPAHAAVI